MKMEINSIEESSFHTHYVNRRSIAAAYLLSVGAKALFYDAAGVSHDIAVVNMKAEALANRTQIKEEVSRNFITKISAYDGVRVTKRGRNGKLRNIVIKMTNVCPDVSDLLHDSSLQESSFLTWRSVWSMKKKFSLAKLSVATFPDMLQDESGEKGEKGAKGEEVHVATKGGRTPFIRLRNASRNLDLQFENIRDYNGCLEYMSLISQNRSI